MRHFCDALQMCQRRFCGHGIPGRAQRAQQHAAPCRPRARGSASAGLAAARCASSPPCAAPCKSPAASGTHEGNAFTIITQRAQALRPLPSNRGTFRHVVAVARMHIVKQPQLIGGVRQQGQTNLAQIRALLFGVAALRQRAALVERINKGIVSGCPSQRGSGVCSSQAGI